MSRSSVIGVDIGYYYTKVVEIYDKKDMKVIKSVLKEKTPENLLTEEIDEEEVSYFIKSLFSQYNKKNKNIVVALNSKDVILKLLKIPVVDESETEQSIMWEAKQYISTSLDDVNVDYQILKVDEDKNENIVLISAARKSIVNAVVNGFKRAKKVVNIVDVDVLAFLNSFYFNNSQMLNNTFLLVDVGYKSTKLILTTNSIPYFSRFIDFGFEEIINNISQSLDISADIANDKVRNINEIDISEQEALLNVIKVNIKSLCNQIESTLNFYYSGANDNEHKNSVDEILFGGSVGCLMDYLKDEFSAHLDNINKFSQLNPFANFVLESDNILNNGTQAPLYNIAVGLALRNL